MGKRIEFYNNYKDVWFTYAYPETPASIHVIFASEFNHDERAEEAWNESLTAKRKLLRLTATEQALKNCKVERAFFVGLFDTDPCKDTKQHVFTDTNLFDILKNRAMNPKAQLIELEFEDLGMVKGSASDHINMYDILKVCGTFIAEDILNFEAEYYARRHEKDYILPGDYENVLDNMENMNKNELLNASKIVAGKIPNENFKALMDNFTFSGNIEYVNEDFFKKLQKEIGSNNRPLKALHSRYCPITEDIPDPVNHPQHYKSSGGLEAIDCIEAFTEDLSGDLGYCVGNAIKYLCRFNKKGKPVEDLEKAKWYVNRAIENVKKREG